MKLHHMKILVFLPSVLLLLACAGIDKTSVEAPSLTEIRGTVQHVQGNDVTVAFRAPEWKGAKDSPIDEITRQVIQKSFIVEGMRVELDGKPATIREVRGNTTRLTLEKTFPLMPETAVNLKIPKRTIAVVDFDVIRGNEKEAGRMTLEGLTSTLIDSGQFVVLERSKIKAVMNELQLSQSGLAQQKPDQKAGRLFLTDLILTGAFAETKGEWDVNLRLVNVWTGQAIAAVSLRTKLFKPTEMRDASPMNEDFEGLLMDPSWIRKFGKGGGGQGKGQKKTAYFTTDTDHKEGADGSKQSADIDFRFTEDMQQTVAAIENRKKRDLSLYGGVEFYVKATEKLYGQFDIITSNPEDLNMQDRWGGFFDIGTTWKKVRIPFDTLVVLRGWIREGARRHGSKPGDQVIRLDRVEGIRIGIDSKKNPATTGKLWIDKVRFYSD